LLRRREGNQMYYRLQSERVATLCRAVCTQVASEFDASQDIASTNRLIPVTLR
ncbi:MAG: transcriptional regulator, partial [Paucibacter sp.]|nr:transcriptional regulator [Roseateles sp.]